MEEKERLGERIRKIRQGKEISEAELSRRSGLPEEIIERIENGEVYPFLSPLIKISRGLGVRVGTFLDDQKQTGPVITKDSELREVERLRADEPMNPRGMQFYSLALNKAERHMEPFLVDVHPGAPAREKHSTHEGEEFIYVLEGEIEIQYGGTVHLLGKGDSIYYDSIVSHDVRTAGNAPARLLAVVYAPL